MRNVYEQFRLLLPDAPLQVGTVVEVTSGIVTVQLPGGGVLKARGTAAVGQKVFVRAGAVEAVAPGLPLELIEI